MRKPARPAFPSAPVSRAEQIGSVLVVAAPAAALGLAAMRFDLKVLWAAAGAAAVAGAWLLRRPPAWRPPTSASVVGLYLAGYGAVWAVTARNKELKADPVVPLLRGTLLVAAVGLLAAHDLARTGLGPRRKALAAARKLAARKRWPDTPQGFADLPDVRALAAATADDPGPALDLLADPRPEVRRAALAALADRPFWRPSESAVVLAAAKTPDPAVRSTALSTLAHATDANSVAGLTGFLRDPAPEVRAAAGAALMADPARWPVVRDAVRDALASPALAADGPLPGFTDKLTPMAVCDLTSWANEQEPLSTRAVRTLAEHFALKFQTGLYPELPAELGRLVIDAQTPTALRVELAGLLRGLDLLPPDLLDRMTDADQPGPVRLLAAELMLAANPADGDAIDVLRGLGRQPNRETAVTIARLLQAYVGIDLGLPSGPIAPQSRPAAEVAKKVLAWATSRTGHTLPRSPLLRPGSSGSTPELDALPPRVPPRPAGRAW
jgi:hypothetical protein